MNRSSRRVHGFALALYTILALLLSWPLIAQIGRSVPGAPQWAFDESTFVWNIWYFKHALVDNLSTPLHTDLIWYPLGIDLVLYTYNFFHALVAQPLMLAFNLPVANNIALLLSTVLSGYGTFLLVRYLFGKEKIEDQRLKIGRPPQSSIFNLQSSVITSSALLAGLIYAFASNRAVYAALGHYDMVTTQWIPFYALMLLRTLDGRLSLAMRRKAAVLAGVFFAFNGLAEMITAVFLAIFTLIVLADYGARLRQEKRKQRLKVKDWNAGDSGEDSGTGRSQRIARNAQSPNLPISNPQSPIPNLHSSLFNLFLLAVVAFTLWSPALLPILTQFLANDFALKGWGEAIPLSTDLLGWFTPTVLHPVFGGDLVAELRRVQLRALELGVTGFRDLNTVFLGWTTAALALTGALVWGRRVRIWIWTTILFGLFTLGPFLQINGRYRFDLDGVEATFPLPYALLHYIPLIKANRAPNRNSVLLMLALAVLAAYGARWIVGKVNTRRQRASLDAQSPSLQPSIFNLQSFLFLLLASLVLFEHLAIPAPLSDARIPAVYAEIAADPRPVSVMQVPLGWRNSFGVLGSERTQLQYYQTAHGKPMLGGNISRAPDFKMEYFARIPYFTALTEIEFGNDVPEEMLTAARTQAGDLMYLYNTEYVLLFPPISQRFPYADHWGAAWSFVKETLPLEEEPFWTDAGIEAYRVVQPAGDDAFRLDLGTPGTYPYRGEGWDAAEADEPYAASAIWATARESRLFVPLRNVDAGAEYVVRMQVHPFAYAGSSPQSVTLMVNGHVLESRDLVDEWQTVEWTAPGALLIDGLNRLALQWRETATPREVIPGSRAIGTTGVSLPVDAELKAFADGAFIALFDEEGAQIDASAGRAGVNVTVLDGESGAIVAMQGFDTTSNEFESQALAEFLTAIEEGQPVLIATRGDATAFLTQAAIRGLQDLGLGVTLESVQGNQIVAAGIKGAPRSSAVQQLDPEEAFLSISLNRDRRTLAAAVDWVEIAGR
ncbi:MAG: hypothetical protein H6642_18155 [Caldilineaceae bacterium]|nr:hypothetical protein [Caldilineaceae bacterium]